MKPHEFLNSIKILQCVNSVPDHGNPLQAYVGAFFNLFILRCCPHRSCTTECTCFVCVCLISIPLTQEELVARTLLFLPTLIPVLPLGPARWTTNLTRYSSLMAQHRARSLRQHAARITCASVYESNKLSSCSLCFIQFVTIEKKLAHLLAMKLI